MATAKEVAATVGLAVRVAVQMVLAGKATVA